MQSDRSHDSGNGKPWAQPTQFGPYHLQELIASGGMADIWLATDQNGGAFSLRRLRNSSIFNFKERKRFLRGCQVLSRIHHHDCVIGYAGHGKINGSYYLLMEYVEASNLKQLFARDDPVLAENVGNILIDMALALEHVHDSGFMHLDFKPENVLVTRNAGIRLVDFDLAQPKPEKPRKSPDNPGTPAYMAPEQLLRQPFDHRVDIFAYGVSAYEILAGKKPFIGETPDEILRKQIDRTPDFLAPRALNPDIPPALEKAILKCLERDMEKRYPYMSVLVRDVQAALYV
ncbi:MAG: serine/threonine protein kinase [Verrucomicrobia bacterium]|nr:serine/threonine protein kinase [Verrucomicrobiota bacterium]